MQVIDLKGELANSKAGQAAIKQAVDTAAKEHAASTAREKSLKVYIGPACCPLSADNIKLPSISHAVLLYNLPVLPTSATFPSPQSYGLHVTQGVIPCTVFSQICSKAQMAQHFSSCLSELAHRLQRACFVQTPMLPVRTM